MFTVSASTNDLSDDERLDASLEAMVQIIRQETDALAELLPDAVIRQWTTSPALKPREDTTERGSGAYSDPTGDAALDDRRLQVRAFVRDAEALLRETAARTQGVRLGLERAVDRWNGSKA